MSERYFIKKLIIMLRGYYGTKVIVYSSNYYLYLLLSFVFKSYEG